MPYRILLIDSSIAAESPAFQALSKSGQVIRARSVLEAVAQCDKLQPDIVVADCPVDGMDAADIYTELKDNGCAARVIALAYPDASDGAERDKGPDVVFHKPLTWAQLQAAVRDVLAALPGRDEA